MRAWMVLIVLALGAISAQAQAAPATQADAHAQQPVFSDDARWIVPWVLIPAGAMFLAAIAIGIVARMEVEEEIPTHSHDEPPGAAHDHGHGHGGHGH